MNTTIHIYRRLLTLAAILGMALTFAFGAPASTGAQQVDPCVTPTATDFPIGTNPTATATEFPITSDPTNTPTEFPITSDPTNTPTELPIGIPATNTPIIIIANFSQRVDDNKDGPNPGCVTPEPTHCNITPTIEPTATWTPEPTATDPVPGFMDDHTLAFAQPSCDPGEGEDPTPVTTDLPKTGTGADSGLQTTFILGVMAAGTLLFAAVFASNRKRNART